MNAEEYNQRLNEEIAKLEQYRLSIKQEFEQSVIDQQKVEYMAKRTLNDSIPDVATTLVNLALGRVADCTPATQFAASKYIYDRVIGTSDMPEKNEMDALLERLKMPLDATHEE